MSRVLFSVFSNVYSLKKGALDLWFQNFIDALRNYGNEVLLLTTNDINKWPEDNCIDSQYFEYKVNQFKPDLIITPNHEIPLSILKCTSCPVVVYTADSPAYFRNKNYIKNNSDRYWFMHGGWNNIFPELLNNIYGISNDRNFYVGHMTAVKAQPLEKKRNIGFIGFIGWPDMAINNLLKCSNQSDFDAYIKKLEDKKINSIEYCQIMTSNIRMHTLESICDLGLECFGIPNNFIPAGRYSWDTMKTFRFKQILSLKDTEEVLNTSVISPNLYNYQAPLGLSWRVTDVMASNAVLISPPKPDLKKVSPYIDIPTFTSPSECRELCKKLIKDEIWRKDILDGCHKAIDESCRPIHLLIKIEKALNIKLVNDQDKKSKPIENLFPIIANSYINFNKNKQTIKNSFYCYVYKAIRKRIKIFTYSLLLLLSQIPLVDFVIRDRQQGILVKKITKYHINR